MEQSYTKSLFRNRTFVLLLFAGFFTIASYSMFITTTTWYVVTDLGSASNLGVILIAATLPRLIMMVFGGVLADTFKKTTVMFSANLAQVIILAIIYYFVALDDMTFLLLLVLTAFFGTIDAFFGPVKTSMIPKIVTKDQLQKANALFQGFDQVSFIMGPLLAGVFMEFGNFSTSYFVATVLVLLSTVLVFPPFIKEAAVEAKLHHTPILDLKEGLFYVLKSKYLITGIIILISYNFLVMGAIIVSIPLVVDLYGGTPIHLSYLEVSLGIGMVIGSTIVGFVQLKNRGNTSIYGLLGAAAVLVVFSQLTDLFWLTMVVFFIGLAMPIVTIPFFTSAQETTDPKLIGRVMSLIYLAMNGFDPIAYGVIPSLIEGGIAIQHVLLSFALLAVLIGLIVLIKGKNYQRI
ncbi:MFS transporter [Geomicrobium sp. JCM 19038]|uniref:MFS transporter n=1 Tax=Geomicrobium sp. JCM 19038 TaxID=1460635 RepID=UPI00045F25FF|nr:MFS transporter [Geomicrobium sp. JCM 19038]GAK08068.1 transporter [Geomicrobium sp. JCM 19038]